MAPPTTAPPPFVANVSAAHPTTLQPLRTPSTASAEPWDELAPGTTSEEGESRKRKKSRGSSGSPPEQASSFKFVTFGNLHGFKQKEVMHSVRRHVMFDFIKKNQAGGSTETPKPLFGQSNVIRPASGTQKQSRKAPKGELPSTEAGPSSSRALEFRKRRRQSSPSPQDSKALVRIGEDESDVEEIIRYSPGIPKPMSDPGRYHSALMTVQTFMASSPNQPLVFPRVEANAPYPFDLAFPGLQLSDIDFTDVRSANAVATPVGGVLDAFGILPHSSFARVPVEYLKFHCSRFFGTRAMGVSWVPALLRSRTAFLGTLALASTHLDTVTSGYPSESTVTTLVKHEVIHLVNRALLNPDPNVQVEDSVMMAVSTMLATSLPTGNVHEMRTHEVGLERMVLQRGGFAKLGLRGDLANSIVSGVLQSAFYRGQEPSQMFYAYAASLAREHVRDPPGQPIPENPVWCPRGEYLTIPRSQLCAPILFELLSDVRDLTNEILGTTSVSAASIFTASPPQPSPKRQSKQRRPSAKDESDARARAQRIQTIYAKIKAFPPAKAPASPAHADPIYESCRIASVLYATALANGITLADAVTVVERADSSLMLGKPVLSALHANLLRSNANLSDCWSDHMTGVLFWAALVAAAAASPADQGTRMQREEPRERKWLVALASRCCILLLFQHPAAVTGTLARLNRVLHKARSMA